MSAPPIGSWLRRHRAVLTIAALVVLTVAVLSLLTATSGRRSGALDPQNPSSGGAQAVARVLADQGVQVSVVRRAAELERTRVDPGTTVVVTGSQNLGRSSARRLGQHTLDAGALVLPAPTTTLTRALDLPVVPDDVPVGGRTSAGCRDPLLSGLVLEVPASSAYRPRSAGAVVSCFTTSGSDASAWVVRVGGADGPEGADRADERPATYVVGADSLFSNQRIDDADNAAVALRLLGQGGRLVWYVPDLRDVALGDTGSLAAQLPGGLAPALGLVAASVVATMVWRGRRLGPLVVEPLPVAVKAVESTQGRGRLYRRVRDRSHAADILRAATRRRLVHRLGLPPGTGVDGLASSVAAATGADPAFVADLLANLPVTDDSSLTRLAADLSALEREVNP